MFNARKPGYSLKNVKLSGVESDTGWIESGGGRCWTSWDRRIKGNRDADSIIQELLEAGDHPGWTGIQRAVGLEKNGEIVLTTTYDSGD